MIVDGPRVASGLDRLVEEGFRRLRGRKIGLIANPSTVDRRLRHGIDLLHHAPGVELVRLFGPEHGLRGEVQDMLRVDPGTDTRTGLPIVSLYGATPETLKPRPEDLEGLDCLIFDLQDVGSRYYTFFATMFYAMETASEVGCSFLVLDRPNPLGGWEIEGPTVEEGYESFVGAYPIPIRHGMTVGELARLFRSERGLDLDLDVVTCSGWAREMFWPETGLVWVPPSPNMPTFDTVLVYPGACLIEGTNLSEGRGTTRPFEWWGAPWLERDVPRMVETLTPCPGALLRPVAFQPVFHKHGGATCFGVQPHVVDPKVFSGLETYLRLLVLTARAEPNAFAWRTEPYEFVEAPLAIDLLFGSSRPRLRIEEAARAEDFALDRWCEDVTAPWRQEARAFRERRRANLLYPERD